MTRLARGRFDKWLSDHGSAVFASGYCALEHYLGLNAPDSSPLSDDRIRTLPVWAQEFVIEFDSAVEWGTNSYSADDTLKILRSL